MTQMPHGHDVVIGTGSVCKTLTITDQLNQFSTDLLEEVALLESIAATFKARLENILNIDAAGPSPDSPDRSPEHGCTSIAESIRRIKTVRDELQQIVQML